MCFADYIVDASFALVVLIGIYFLIGVVDKTRFYLWIPFLIGGYILMDFLVRQGTVVLSIIASWMELSMVLISVGFLGTGNIWKNFMLIVVHYVLSSSALTLLVQVYPEVQEAYVTVVSYQYIHPLYGTILAILQVIAAWFSIMFLRKMSKIVMRFVSEKMCRIMAMCLYVISPVFYFIKVRVIVEQTFHISETKIPYWLLVILCTIFHLVQFEIVALILSKVQQGYIKKENEAREVAIEKEKHFVSELRKQNMLLQRDAGELLKKKKLLSVSGNLNVDYFLLEVEKKVQDMGGVLQTSIAPINKLSINEMEMLLLLEQITSFGLEQMAQTAGKDKWMNLVIRVHHEMLIVKMEFTKARLKRDIRYEKKMRHVISLTKYANGYYDYREANCIGELSIMIP